MRKKYLLFIVLGLLLVVIIVAAIFIYSYLNNRIYVPMATHTIRPWERIESEDFKMVELKDRSFIDSIIVDENEIIDKYVLGMSTIYPDSYFYKGSIVHEDEINIGTYRYLNNDEVAYDIYVSDIKINVASISDGMSIDLYLTIKDGSKVYSDLLLSNAYILAKYDKEGKLIRGNNLANSFSIRLKREYIPYINKALIIGELSAIISSSAYSQNELKLNENSEIIGYLINEEVINSE